MITKLLFACVVVLYATLLIKAQDVNESLPPDVDSSSTNMTACKLGFDLCGSECYNVTSHQCFNGTLCDIDMTGVCGDTCYSAYEHVCFKNSILCYLNETLCGYSCLGQDSVCKTILLACSEEDFFCKNFVKLIERFAEQIIALSRAIWNTVQFWDWKHLYYVYTSIFSSPEYHQQEESLSNEEVGQNATQQAENQQGLSEQTYPQQIQQGEQNQNEQQSEQQQVPQQNQGQEAKPEQQGETQQNQNEQQSEQNLPQGQDQNEQTGENTEQVGQGEQNKQAQAPQQVGEDITQQSSSINQQQPVNVEQNVTQPSGQTSRCSGFNCPNGELCCDDVLVGPLCYLPTEHTCTFLGNGTFRYCCCANCIPCGSDLRCFNTLTHKCVNGVVFPIDRPVPEETPSAEEILFCFGLPANDATVCSGHGTCVGIDTCNCTKGWTGLQCNVSTACRAGYTGPDCSIPICFSQQKNDVNVCSGHGICAAPDKCVCRKGYTGIRCDQKICQRGFTGTDCNIPICFFLPATDRNVCSGHGSCVAPNHCNCTDSYIGAMCERKQCPMGYIGLNCNIPVCFSQPAFDRNVCSRHGSCIAPNQCNCTSGWTGPRCHMRVCPSGYGGFNCDIPICYSQPATDRNVCSGHGTCVAPDRCNCTAGYQGDRCDVQIPKACDIGYTGENCDIPICSSLPANDVNVCSGNGRCVAPDQCQCNEGFSGSTCSEKISKCNTVSCKSGELCCDDILVGPLCYSPTEHTCTPLGNGTFRYCCCANCIPCGSDLRCFNTLTHKCVNNVVVPIDRNENTTETSTTPTTTPSPSPITPQSSPVGSDTASNTGNIENTESGTNSENMDSGVNTQDQNAQNTQETQSQEN